MDRRNCFYFNGVSSLNNGIVVSRKSVLNGPEPILEEYQIKKRDGRFFLFTGYSNIEVEYETVLKVPEPWSFSAWMSTVKGWLLGNPGKYMELSDTYDLEHYRQAAYIDGLEVKNEWKTASRQNIRFSCKPYRYLKTGDDMVSGSAATSLTVYNPTSFDAKPLIQVTHGMSFASSAVLTISYEDGTQYEGNLSNLGQSDFAFVIDSEEQIIRNGNEQTSPELFAAELDFFPVLKPGENTISISGSGLSTLGVWPKWREL